MPATPRWLRHLRPGVALEVEFMSADDYEENQLGDALYDAVLAALPERGRALVQFLGFSQSEEPNAPPLREEHDVGALRPRAPTTPIVWYSALRPGHYANMRDEVLAAWVTVRIARIGVNEEGTRVASVVFFDDYDSKLLKRTTDNENPELTRRTLPIVQLRPAWDVRTLGSGELHWYADAVEKTPSSKAASRPPRAKAKKRAHTTSVKERVSGGGDEAAAPASRPPRDVRRIWSEAEDCLLKQQLTDGLHPLDIEIPGRTPASVVYRVKKIVAEAPKPGRAMRRKADLVSLIPGVDRVIAGDQPVSPAAVARRCDAHTSEHMRQRMFSELQGDEAVPLAPMTPPDINLTQGDDPATSPTLASTAPGPSDQNSPSCTSDSGGIDTQTNALDDDGPQRNGVVPPCACGQPPRMESLRAGLHCAAMRQAMSGTGSLESLVLPGVVQVHGPSVDIQERSIPSSDSVPDSATADVAAGWMRKRPAPDNPDSDSEDESAEGLPTEPRARQRCAAGVTGLPESAPSNAELPCTSGDAMDLTPSCALAISSAEACASVPLATPTSLVEVKNDMAAVRNLLHDFGLEAYADKFEEEGYDDMELIWSLRLDSHERELDKLAKATGMKQGHRARLKTKLLLRAAHNGGN